MLGRIILIVAFAGVAAWLWASMRRNQRRRVPMMPDRWRLLAAVDERLHEAVNMRDRLAELADRNDNALDRAIVQDVDELVASVSDVVELRIELQRHLQVLDRQRLAEDAAFLDEGQRDRQSKMLTTLEQRPEQLQAEVAHAVGDLRELYLYALDNMHKPGLAHEDVVQRTRDRAAQLRERIDAEHELKRYLADEKVTVH